MKRGVHTRVHAHVRYFSGSEEAGCCDGPGYIRSDRYCHREHVSLCLLLLRLSSIRAVWCAA